MAMKHRLAAIALVASSLCGSAWGQQSQPNYAISSSMTLEEIAANLRAALPAGTPLAKIDAYLSANEIDHSYYPPSNQVFAIVRRISGGLFVVNKSAQILITLDATGGLTRVEVIPQYTGP
jgi:hypothetical protein